MPMTKHYRSLKNIFDMRALRVDDGSLVECDSDTFRYAILSHTWSPNEKEEYNFKDVEMNTGTKKPGFRKVDFCMQQARKDGLDFVWIDTCCIDRSSSTELTEAINSMFAWYRDAAKCYVFLSDVSTGSEDSAVDINHKGLPWQPAFEQSRWFTRSWTLQELLAPKSVEFYSREGNLLGKKTDLYEPIHRITGIPSEILQHPCRHPASEFTVQDRFKWAQNRQAKREEDRIYSLLGLFGIHMPLLYGEGRKKAMVRLRREILLAENQSDSDSVESLSQDTHEQNEIYPSQYVSSQDRHRTFQETNSDSFDTYNKAGVRVKRSRAGPQRHRSHERSHKTEDDAQQSHSFINGAYGIQFATFGGTQINNTGRGNQFTGDFYGSVRFG